MVGAHWPHRSEGTCAVPVDSAKAAGVAKVLRFPDQPSINFMLPSCPDPSSHHTNPSSSRLSIPRHLLQTRSRQSI